MMVDAETTTYRVVHVDRITDEVTVKDTGLTQSEAAFLATSVALAFGNGRYEEEFCDRCGEEMEPGKVHYHKVLHCTKKGR